MFNDVSRVRFSNTNVNSSIKDFVLASNNRHGTNLDPIYQPDKNASEESFEKSEKAGMDSTYNTEIKSDEDKYSPEKISKNNPTVNSSKNDYARAPSVNKPFNKPI